MVFWSHRLRSKLQSASSHPQNDKKNIINHWKTWINIDILSQLPSLIAWSDFSENALYTGLTHSHKVEVESSLCKFRSRTVMSTHCAVFTMRYMTESPAGQRKWIRSINFAPLKHAACLFWNAFIILITCSCKESVSLTKPAVFDLQSQSWSGGGWVSASRSRESLRVRKVTDELIWHEFCLLIWISVCSCKHFEMFSWFKNTLFLFDTVCSALYYRPSDSSATPSSPHSRRLALRSPTCYSCSSLIMQVVVHCRAV